MSELFVGVDVQVARPCPYTVLDANGLVIAAGWLKNEPPEACIEQLKSVLETYRNHQVVVGIDAPRCPLRVPRQWSWHRNQWVPAGSHHAGNGRHCEVVVKAHRLANPQWTPCGGQFPDWMSLGFSLFRELDRDFAVQEVFPSASYYMLQRESFSVSVRLGDLFPFPKDMLDAYVSAATIREFAQGRGCEVGGGDGLGTIILPRRLHNPITDVLRWPTDRLPIGAAAP